MSKVSKRQIEDLLARWPESQAKLLAEGASEKDVLDAFMPLKALMHDKGIWEAPKFDTAELLDGILAVREFFRLQKDIQADTEDLSLANTALAETLHDGVTADLAAFIFEVHRIVNAQERRGGVDEDKAIKQELYNLFERGGLAKQRRQEDRWKVMIRYIILNRPDDDMKQRKKWAQQEFVEELLIWTEKTKGRDWKLLEEYWSRYGDPIPLSDIDEKYTDAVAKKFCKDYLRQPLRSDRRKRAKKLEK
ncbi:hypothetical protein N9U42_03530 [Luminiphilus sp.]|nr:hypothetical protein [Luminiphilus sp.]MDA9711420.1 hypothetical protein [Luminiphilus sp.]